MARTTLPTEGLMGGLAGLQQELDGRGPRWLRRLRAAGRARLERTGFPTRDLEDWRNTSVAPIVEGAFRPAGRTEIARDRLPAAGRLDLGGPRLVFVDGRYSPALSAAGGCPDGVICTSIAEALERMPDRLESWLAPRDADGRSEDEPPFAALNTAFLEDGGLVVLPEGARLERPIQIVYLAGGSDGPTVAQPRTRIVAGRESRAVVVESYLASGDGPCFTNAVTRVSLGDNARLDHLRVQNESPSGHHVAFIESQQGRDSRYLQHNVSLGGKLVRNDVRAALLGEGAHCLLYGLYVTRGAQHVDNHTVLDHARPHGDSREVYRGVLCDRSRTVFNGRIVVREGAQKTDAKQSNPNLLLSDRALAHTRPQLEIYADDVKCTHGATVGRLDADAIFYLRSRGIPEIEARNLLVRAFVGEVLERIEIAPLREMLEEEVDRRLPGGGGGSGARR